MPTGANAEERVPPGAVLPDGRLLLFTPSRGCDCEDCRDAFRALDRGTLTLPEEVAGPWAA